MKHYFLQPWRNYLTTHLICWFWKDATSVITQCLSSPATAHPPTIAERRSIRDRQSVLDGLHLFPSSRQLCDSIDEANWTASGSLSVLFRLTWCIMSRKLSIDQFTLFNYSLSYLITFLVYCFPLFKNARNVNFYDKLEISILLSVIVVFR